MTDPVRKPELSEIISPYDRGADFLDLHFEGDGVLGEPEIEQGGGFESLAKDASENGLVKQVRQHLLGTQETRRFDLALKSLQKPLNARAAALMAHKDLRAYGKTAREVGLPKFLKGTNARNIRDILFPFKDRVPRGPGPLAQGQFTYGTGINLADGFGITATHVVVSELTGVRGETLTDGHVGSLKTSWDGLTVEAIDSPGTYTIGTMDYGDIRGEHGDVSLVHRQGAEAKTGMLRLRRATHLVPGKTKLWMIGRLTSERYLIAAGVFLGAHQKNILVSSAVEPGFSGGLIVTDEGDMVGVISARDSLNGCTWGVGAEAISDLLDRARESQPNVPVLEFAEPDGDTPAPAPTVPGNLACPGAT